ncbi:hypothetical protein GCM10007876_25270 [Litoribrevibacter albus]|uniref:Uncharacterized protein n=1 Tax=Litoribrevibacter albus TaxID=1473156 RepID=A0AA37SC60_9GAMM|nr:hypothetical protein GCM10007876_25270 [Litoribrevibacter albus]
MRIELDVVRNTQRQLNSLGSRIKWPSWLILTSKCGRLAFKLYSIVWVTDKGTNQEDEFEGKQSYFNFGVDAWSDYFVFRVYGC